MYANLELEFNQKHQALYVPQCSVALIVELLFDDPSKNVPITQTKSQFDMLSFLYLILMLRG